MDENKIIDAEYTEVTDTAEAAEVVEEKKDPVDSAKATDDLNVPPEDLFDLMGEVNDLVDAYVGVFTATKEIIRKTVQKGYSSEKSLNVATVLSKRASDKAGKIVSEKDGKK